MGHARRTDNDAFYILNFCDDLLGTKGSREYTFDWLLGDLSLKTGRRTKLPVDSFWESLNLVIEVMENQHYVPTRHFDKPDVLTVSGVHRGIQRRLYDERRIEQVPLHGLVLVTIPIAEFEVRSKKIRRNPERDIKVVRRILGESGFAS